MSHKPHHLTGAFLCLLVAALCCSALSATGWADSTENPLTVDEMCTMLKGGSTSDDVLHALTSRELMDSVSEAQEAQLRTAGASAHLLDAAKSGTYTLTPFQAADARKRMAAGGTSAGGGTNPTHMANLLHGKLVTLANGSLQPYDDRKLAGKKYFGLYYSAHWCPPCRKFTPELVTFYKQMEATHPDLEIVFVSSDYTAADMKEYMQLVGMTWPALRFERIPQEKELTHYCGDGIPDLVVVDGNGKVLSDSYQGKEYVGPYKVLTDLGQLLARQ